MSPRDGPDVLGRGLPGHVSLITGGNSGIGLGMAIGLATAGADLAIWGTNAAKNAAAAARLRAIGSRVHVEQCDVSSEDQVESSFAKTVAALGRVDSVFANAGMSAVPRNSWEIPLDEWRKVHSVNIDGVFLTLRAGARHMVERGEGGSLIGVASTSSIHGAPTNAAYASSKTAVLGLVRAMAVGLARHRVRVNALTPGWTATDMLAPAARNEKFVNNTIGRTPVRRWADPAEFAKVAVFLADPSLTFHTGDTLVVDGGYTIF